MVKLALGQAIVAADLDSGEPTELLIGGNSWSHGTTTPTHSFGHWRQSQNGYFDLGGPAHENVSIKKIDRLQPNPNAMHRFLSKAVDGGTYNQEIDVPLYNSMYWNDGADIFCRIEALAQTVNKSPDGTADIPYEITCRGYFFDPNDTIKYRIRTSWYDEDSGAEQDVESIPAGNQWLLEMDAANWSCKRVAVGRMFVGNEPLSHVRFKIEAELGSGSPVPTGANSETALIRIL